MSQGNLYMSQHKIEVYRWNTGVLVIEELFAETFLHALAVIDNIEDGVLCKIYNSENVLVHTNSNSNSVYA